MSRRGFTLLEVMVAMGILAFLSLFTVQAIQKALFTKAKVQKDIDKQTTLRDALRVMERDINLAFNYRDASIQLYNEAQDVRKANASKQKNPQGGAPTGSSTLPTPPPAPTQSTVPGIPDPTDFSKKNEKIYTQFLGDEESLNFTSLSNVRLTENSPISSQAEIGYRLKSCRRRTSQEQSSNCLWRRISNYIHDDITKEGQETVLLENIVDLKLRYLGPGKNGEWVSQWASGEGGDDTTKGNFPYAVEITIEVKDVSPEAKDKSLRMTTVAAIRNPNNPKPKSQNPEVPANDGSAAPAN